ncbi:MAG: hypothetical protein DI585_04770 [Pseudomonas fluorescens]|nr:MAG: hypothetical protein DI585_04770 [Pseudomonas fluorescens]
MAARLNNNPREPFTLKEKAVTAVVLSGAACILYILFVVIGVQPVAHKAQEVIDSVAATVTEAIE